MGGGTGAGATGGGGAGARRGAAGEKIGAGGWAAFTLGILGVVILGTSALGATLLMTLEWGAKDG